MSIVETIRESKLRYGIPWSMTLARPILGAAAVYESVQDRPWNALGLLVLAQATDMDGWVARTLGATTTAGAIADPLSDGALRLETAAIIAPLINPIMGLTALTAEATNLALNARIQRDHTVPVVPQEAKTGTAMQSVGAAVMLIGEAAAKPPITVFGSLALTAGSINRTAGYGRVYSETRKNSQTS